LSKSKVLAFRQCPRRLWLEIHHPDLAEVSEEANLRFAGGHQLGELARRLYDPKGRGRLVDLQAEGIEAALAHTQDLLKEPLPIFEAGFEGGGAKAFADVLLPVKRRGQSLRWRMVEVKSSTSVKDYHRNDVAVQAYAAHASGVALQAVHLARVDSHWTYPGGGDYDGILVEEDLTDDALDRGDEVALWLDEGHRIARKRVEPSVPTGEQCNQPFECAFRRHCAAGEVPAEFPVQWLPKVATKALKARLAEPGVQDLRQVDDDLLNARQLRVKQHTLADTTYFDADGARAALAPFKGPWRFLDFETIAFVVPIWKGTRPYQQIPFQFSLHTVGVRGKESHAEFLDLSGADPRKALAIALIEACGDSGPVFAFNVSFERGRILEMAASLPRQRKALNALAERLVDLLPVAEQCYYHPSQQGSWSIKKLLPAMAPDLSYEALQGVQGGGAATAAYIEAIGPDTTPARKAELDQQLRAYCQLDTYAMVRVWRILSGRQALPGPSMQVE
jgi:CRISPR/Cas system-associated exonuclease Cas4 (RecB family)